MKKSIQALFSLILLLFAAMLFLNGCKKDDKDVIVTINDTKLTIEDFLYDIYLIETEGNALEEYYQTNLGSSYWDFERDGITVREAAKDAIFSRVIMYEILMDQAKKAGIVLTEEEIAANKAAVDSLISSAADTSLVDSGLNRELLIDSYNRLSLGDKYYLTISGGFSVDKEAIQSSISREEYREYKTECLYVPSVRSENQELIVLSDDELDKMLKSIAEAYEKITAGADITKVLAEDVNLTLYTRDFIIGDSIPEQEYKNAAIALENGEYSEIVSTNYGYYIIHMLDNNSDSRYEKAIKDAVTAEEQAQFKTIYEELKAQYKIEIDSEKYDSITIGSKASGSKQP